MSLTPDEKIYNLVTILQPLLKDLKKRNNIDSKLADSISEELDKLRRI